MTNLARTDTEGSRLRASPAPDGEFLIFQLRDAGGEGKGGIRDSDKIRRGEGLRC